MAVITFNKNASRTLDGTKRSQSHPDIVVGTRESDLTYAKEKVLFDGTMTQFDEWRRQAPWAGQGTDVAHKAMTAQDALRLGGLNWTVEAEEIYDRNGVVIPGAKAMVRQDTRDVLGINGNKYKIVQNEEAFSWLDNLVGGAGLEYQTVGTWNGGSRVWMLGKLPKQYDILGDFVDCYLAFLNSHDGSSAVKVMVTPLRIKCSNMLALAIRSAKQSWSCRHTASINGKMDEARDALKLTEVYMSNLATEFERLYQIKMDKDKMIKFTKDLVPTKETETANNHAEEIRADVMHRVLYAPDLIDTDMTAARYLQAVADTASHMEPIRKTKNYASNRFMRLATSNNNLVNKAYTMLTA